jgi:peptide/nickel transport system substrate-binding protein
MTAEPDLAESWTSNDTLTEWTFRLRDNLRFHDASSCTAKDVAATFAAILDPKTTSPARTNVGPIKDIVVQDDRTAVPPLSAVRRHARGAGLHERPHHSRGVRCRRYLAAVA